MREGEILEIYLDNAATTKPREEVVEANVRVFSELFGNPSSLHRKGVEIEKEIKKVRKNVATSLGCADSEVYFTSGGTESNNISIQGIAKAYLKNGNHLITTNIEHPSVLNVFRKLENEGFKVSYIDVDKNGSVSPSQLYEAITDKTILISIMHVNNETGRILPIKEIGRKIKKASPRIVFHVDATQSYGKLNLDVENFLIDSLSISGHKIHATKGVGALYVRKGVKVSPLYAGGGQESGLRVGTENASAILGLGEAVKACFSNQHITRAHVKIVKEHLFDGIKNTISTTVINGSIDDSFSPYIINIAFLGVKAEVLLHSLEQDGIYVSTGSACSSTNNMQSHVLKAMGLKRLQIESSLRFSFSRDNTIEEMDYVIERIKKHVYDIRKIVKRI